MKNKDEYLAYTRKDGTIFYYKNKKLHREAGPAIVIHEEFKKYTNLEDEGLYKKVTNPVIVSSSNDFEIKTLPNGDFMVYERSITYYVGSSHYINGIFYSEQQFNAIKLKEYLDKTISKSEDKEETKTKV